MACQRSPPAGLSVASATNLQSTQSDPALNTLRSGEESNVNAAKRSRRRLDNDSYISNEFDNSPLLVEMKRLFDNSDRQQHAKFERLETRMNDILEQNSKIQDSITFFSQKYDDLLERLDVTERENTALKKQINSMESKIDYLERQARSTIIEISNFPASVPETKESLTATLCNITAAISHPLPPTDIKNIYRLKSKSDHPHTPGTVVAEFYSDVLKENVLKASRQYNKDNKNSKLSTTSIRLPGPPTPIYIAESLTSFGKHLFYLGRKLQREGKCDSCWSSHGRIYIKKKSTSTPYCIVSEQELQKYMSSAK